VAAKIKRLILALLSAQLSVSLLNFVVFYPHTLERFIDLSAHSLMAYSFFTWGFTYVYLISWIARSGYFLNYSLYDNVSGILLEIIFVVTVVILWYLALGLIEKIIDKITFHLYNSLRSKSVCPLRIAKRGESSQQPQAEGRRNLEPSG